MLTLSLAGASLMVTWTDPTVIGAAALGLAAIAVGGFLASRSQGQPSTTGPETSPSGTSQPPPTPNPDMDKRAEQAREKAKEQAQQAASASPENLARGKGRSLAEMAANETVDDTELISRFVLDTNGDRIGETLTITDGEVILKREDGFFSVPPDAIIEKDGTLLADANIDWDKAREAGKAWEDENLDRMEYDDTGMPVKG